MLDVLSRNIPGKSLYLSPDPRSRKSYFCHSEVIMGNIFPEEEEEGEQEQTSQKVGFFLLYNHI